MQPEELLSILQNSDWYEHLSAEDALKVVQLARAHMEGLEYLRLPHEDTAFVGDIHGDLTSLTTLTKQLLLQDGFSMVFLGDYGDRNPPDCPYGGIGSTLFLLALKAANPSRVFLLRGNHEAYSILPFIPYDIPMELHKLFGNRGPEILRALESLYDSLSLYAVHPSGVCAVHGGVPVPWTDRVTAFLWGDPAVIGVCRGPVSRETAFDEGNLTRFLGETGCSVLVRGHTPLLNGTSLYGGRVLTVTSTRSYGGPVLVALCSKGKMGIDSLELRLLEGESLKPYTPRAAWGT